VEGLKLALRIDSQIPQDDNDEQDEGAAMTWRSHRIARILGEIDIWSSLQPQAVDVVFKGPVRSGL
jgi:hypothetical protein